MISSERPGKTGYRCKNVEQGDEDNQDEDYDEEICNRFGLGRLVVYLNNGKSCFGGCDLFNIADCKEKTDRKGKLHDCVHDYRCHHRTWDMNTSTFYLIRHVENPVKTWR